MYNIFCSFYNTFYTTLRVAAELNIPVLINVKHVQIFNGRAHQIGNRRISTRLRIFRRFQVQLSSSRYSKVDRNRYFSYF